MIFYVTVLLWQRVPCVHCCCLQTVILYVRIYSNFLRYSVAMASGALCSLLLSSNLEQSVLLQFNFCQKFGLFVH